MHTNPGVSLLIPNWNGLALLEQFLPSVIASARFYSSRSRAPVEILIVDDGSADDSVAWLSGQGFEERSSEEAVVGGQEPRGREAGEQEGRSVDSAESFENVDFDSDDKDESEDSSVEFFFIRSEKNNGFGEACNRGFAAAKHPLVFLLNNDVEVSEDAISPLVERFTDDSVFAVHCRVFEFESGRECGTGKVGGFHRGFIRVHQSYAARYEKGEGEYTLLYSMFASGGSAMFDRRKFLELGGFEPLLAPFYWEDVEISYRAWKRGYAVLYEPRSVVRHRVSSTMRRIDRRKVRRIQQRNRLIFHWINLHQSGPMALHVLWVTFLAMTSPFLMKPGFLFSFFDALKLLPSIRKRRREERVAAKLTDREVFDIFRELKRCPHIFVYDDYSELKQFQETAQSDRDEKSG